MHIYKYSLPADSSVFSIMEVWKQITGRGNWDSFRQGRNLGKCFKLSVGLWSEPRVAGTLHCIQSLHGLHYTGTSFVFAGR